jgi:hypothetical protein
MPILEHTTDTAGYTQIVLAAGVKKRIKNAPAGLPPPCVACMTILRFVIPVRPVAEEDAMCKSRILRRLRHSPSYY